MPGIFQKISLLLLVVVLTMGYTFELPAQMDSLTGWRNKKIAYTSDLLTVDSLTILPASVIIRTTEGDTLEPIAYRISNGTIQLDKTGTNKKLTDSLHLSYRTTSLNLGRSFFRLDSIALAQTDDVIKTGYQFSIKNKENNLFGQNDLLYDGSFSRGFSVGNRQSLVLNSNFNLQMSGFIGDDIELAAALTDANIPIQAEGNTYQLNEFDRVYISLKKDQHALSAGDLEITNPGTYFSRYKKKLKGLRYTDKFSFEKDHQLGADVSYAISKGKFARNELETQEGNQGPYKLVGTAGERFLIILSGTEKVYYDGVPLKRGSNNDYIIDYNLAEIRFTHNRLITKDSRIIVEFEYVDQSYLRSMQTVGLDWQKGKSRTYFNLYNEQDSKQALGNIGLDSTDVRVLENSGDDFSLASRSGVRNYNENEGTTDVVLYRKVFEPSINDSILVYSEEDTGQLFTAYFSDVGENNGAYAIKNETTVNGRVYEYVGDGNGRYDPVIRLVAPEQKQLIVLGNEYAFSDNTHLRSELSLSNNDENRFSPLDDSDNLGGAAHFHFETKRNYAHKKDSLFENTLSASVEYEYTDKKFQALNPYRAAEFNRDWNVETTQDPLTEHLFDARLGGKWKTLDLHYGLGGFIRQNWFRGFRHSPGINLHVRNTQLDLSGDFLHSESNERTTRFYRPKISFQQKIPWLANTKLGFNFNQERNRINKKDSLTLEKTSFYFNNYKVLLQGSAQSRFPFQLQVGFRQDFQPDGEAFSKNFRALDAGFSGKWKIEKISNLDFSLKFRQLKIDSLFTGQTIKPANTLLGKINHVLKISDDFLVTNTQLDMNSGQEAKAEFVFIELTNPGEGNYIWIDSNEDGIRQKGEFEEAPFSDEANFIKIIQYNNEFVRVNNAVFNHTFRLNPKQLIQGTTDRFWQNQLSKFSAIGSIKYQEKTSDLGSTAFQIPFFSDIPDSSIVVLNRSRNLSFYYNKLSRVFDVQFNHKAIRSRNLQLDGLIEHGTLRNQLRLRYSFKKSVDVVVSGTVGTRDYRAALYPTKDYDFRFSELSGEIRYRLSQKTGFQLDYSYVDKQNESAQMEKLSGSRLKAKLSLRNWYQMNLQFSLEYARFNYSGEANTSLELAMLEGLKNGNNYLWQASLTRKMSNNIDLSFRYEGRKTGDLKTVHVANMQAKARF